MDLLSAGDSGSRSWHFLLWHQWVAALHAEAAVLAHDPGAARHLAESQSGRRSRGALTRCRAGHSSNHLNRTEITISRGESLRVQVPVRLDPRRRPPARDHLPRRHLTRAFSPSEAWNTETDFDSDNVRSKYIGLRRTRLDASSRNSRFRSAVA